MNKAPDPRPKKQGVSRNLGARNLGLGARLGAWLDHHSESRRDALRRLFRRPVGQLLSMLVIGLSLTLPITMLLTLDAARTGLAGWSNELGLVQIFLKQEASGQAQRLLTELQADSRLRDVRLIPAEEGLKQLATLHQFDGLLAEMKSNPLPVVIEVYPYDSALLEALRGELAARSEVASARIDAQAVERLHGLIDAGERLLALFLLILTPTLAITVSNTIRLELEHRVNEIRLLQLVGATPAFIRRPLLYAGGILGLGGTLMGLGMTAVAVGVLLDALARVGWSFSFPSTPPLLLFVVIPAGFILGLMAAWLASLLQMRHIRPV